MNRKEKLRVAALGDLHAHETSRGQYRELFAEVSTKADVLILCGDLTNLGLPEEAKVLADDLQACTIPIVAVLGNHDYHSDRINEVKKVFMAAGVVLLEEEETYEIKGVGFAGTKGFMGGFENYMLSAFGEEAIKNFVQEAVNESLKLENSLKALETKTIVVVLHYSPVAQTVKGEPPEIWTFLGSSRLAEVIDRFDNVAAVFHGHVHHGSMVGQTPKGIPVYNSTYALLKETQHNTPYVLLEV